MTTITSKPSESLQASIPQDILEELDRIAAIIGKSRNWVFNEALKQYLDVQRWQIELIHKRFVESESKKAEFIPHDKFMEKKERQLKARLNS